MKPKTTVQQLYEQEPLWTVKEVAKYLRMSSSWVYKMAEAGLLPVRRIGSSLRFDPEEIRAYARGEWEPKRASARHR